MNDAARGKGGDPADGVGGGSVVRYYKKDFWSTENLKFSQPHFRLEKSARIINRIACGKECALLDVGCGPAALRGLLSLNIQYYGIDIAIHEPASYLVETDLVEKPIKFGDMQFDIVIAQGVFEYLGGFQPRKFAEIAQLLNPNGVFIVSYWNFGHRDKQIYWPFSNIRSIDDFRNGLSHYFNIDRSFPAAHNWHHSEPNRKLTKFINMYLNVNVPVISPLLAVEYFFICSARE